VVAAVVSWGCGDSSSTADLTGKFSLDQDTPSDAEQCKGRPTPPPSATCTEPHITDVSPRFGRPGSTVTIMGRGFGERQGLSKVTFNAIEAVPDFEGLEARPGGDVLSWTDEEIVVRVPERAANEPEQPARVVVSCGFVDWLDFDGLKVPVVQYVDSNDVGFDIRQPGSVLDMGFWVFRMGTFGNEHLLTDDPVNPCDIRMRRCRLQPARYCDKNDIDLGKYGVSSSQCAGLGIPWGGLAYTASSNTGLDIDGDGEIDLEGGVLENADRLGLYPESNRDLETGNFPETLYLYGDDVELVDSSGYVGLRRVRDKKGQVRYGITCSFCHIGDHLGQLPAISASSEPLTQASVDAVSSATQTASTTQTDGGQGKDDGSGLSDASGGSAASADGGSMSAAAVASSASSDGADRIASGGGGPVHREGTAEELGPDPNNPVFLDEGNPEQFLDHDGNPVYSPEKQGRHGEARFGGLMDFLTALISDEPPPLDAPGPFGTSEVSPMGVDPNNPAPPGAPPRAPGPETQGLAVSPMGVDPNNPAPPGAPLVSRGPGTNARPVSPMGVDPAHPAPVGAPVVDRSRMPGSLKNATAPGDGERYAPRPADGNNMIQETDTAFFRPPGMPAPPPADADKMADAYGFAPGGRQAGPVENGMANRTLQAGALLANSRLVAILDEIDPLPGKKTRRQILLDTGVGRFDFHGYPRIPGDAVYEAVPLPHHFATTGFTRLLYSDRVPRSPLDEVQRRITQQAHFDFRNMGALLNARSYAGLIRRAEAKVGALRALAIYLNATEHSWRVRPLLKRQAAIEFPNDIPLIEKGREAFECEGCIRCHSDHLGRYTSLAVIPLSAIGTDPRHALAEGNHLEGEGEVYPRPVLEGDVWKDIRGLTWVLEFNQILDPKVPLQARDRFHPLMVTLEDATPEALVARVSVGMPLDGGLSVEESLADRVVLGGTRTGARLSFAGDRLILGADEGTLTLGDVRLRGVLHGDASTWGAPLQLHRLSMVTGTILESSLADFPVGASFRAYLSGVRSDLFAGTRLPASKKSIGYRVPKLVGLRYKVGYLHDGSLGALEDLMDPDRFKPGYVPTGFPHRVPDGYKGVPGHPFTLIDDPEERKALLAFLRTL